MPYAPETRRRDRAGTSKISDLDQLVDLFWFPTIYQLGEVIEPALDRTRTRGRRPSYSASCLLATVAGSRIFASAAEALKTMANPVIWEQCAQGYLELSGEPLPTVAPSYDQVQHFRQRLLEVPGLMGEVQDRFRRLAVAQARQHGNLTRGIEPRWDQHIPAHAVYGDGVVIKPFSDVRSQLHPVTGETVVVGSRAKTPKAARVQMVTSDLSEDDKAQLRGINYVALHTWTSAGRVVLGTASALGAEQWAALELAESLAEIAGGSIHSLIWDKAVTGWLVDYLMSAHRVQVLGKGVARSAELRIAGTAEDPLRLSETALDKRTTRKAAEHLAELTTATQRILRKDVLTEIFHGNLLEPVGTSLYARGDSFEVVHGRSFALAPAEHDTLLGPCRHDLVVDDGALYLVGRHPEEDYLVKTQHLPCVSSRPLQRPDGRWSRVDHYEIPCGSEAFTYVRRWDPDGTRYTPDQPKSGRSADPVGPELRPINRKDEAFRADYSRRNDAESFNNWFQNTLTHYGRAASEGLAGQELDFLAAAISNNSTTWSRSAQSG